METQQITLTCKTLRGILDNCIESNQLCLKDSKKYIIHCRSSDYLNAANNDSRNLVFGLTPLHDGFPNKKVM